MDIQDLLKQYPDLFDALVEWYQDPKMEFSYFEIHRAGKIIKSCGGKWTMRLEDGENDEGVDKD